MLNSSKFTNTSKLVVYFVYTECSLYMRAKFSSINELLTKNISTSCTITDQADWLTYILELTSI